MRNLRDDFRMYYNGSWILRECDGEMQAMCVSETYNHLHGHYPRDIYFHGDLYSLSSSGAVQHAKTNTEFTADQIIAFLPEAGYYMVGGAPMYLEFQIQNRSNRKGFENRGVVLSNGQGVRLTTTDVVKLFLQPDFKGKIFGDIALIKSRVHWRGNDVGQFHDGVLQLDDQYHYLSDYLGKQIETFKGRNGGL